MGCEAVQTLVLSMPWSPVKGVKQPYLWHSFGVLHDWTCFAGAARLCVGLQHSGSDSLDALAIQMAISAHQGVSLP